jgi:hypothetical protein
VDTPGGIEPGSRDSGAAIAGNAPAARGLVTRLHGTVLQPMAAGLFSLWGIISEFLTTCLNAVGKIIKTQSLSSVPGLVTFAADEERKKMQEEALQKIRGFVGSRGYRVGSLSPGSVRSLASVLFGVKNESADDLARQIHNLGENGRISAAKLNKQKAEAMFNRISREKPTRLVDDGSQTWLDREAERVDSSIRGLAVFMARRYPDDKKLIDYCRRIGLRV